MNVFVAPYSNESGKFHSVVQAFPDIWNNSVLDVGCRSGNFKRALGNYNARYCGVDLNPPVDVIANLEGGLPFDEDSFDTVVALDVLEHTNDIHRAFSELCRVARRHLVISLPNVYEMKHRIKFLLGKPLCGKYGLPVEPPSDRHRWLFSLADAQQFCSARGERHGFQILSEGCILGPRRSFAMSRFVTVRFPNLFSTTYLALLGRRES